MIVNLSLPENVTWRTIRRFVNAWEREKSSTVAAAGNLQQHILVINDTVAILELFRALLETEHSHSV